MRNHDLNAAQNEHVYAISCRPEVAGDVISGENVKTIAGYTVLNSKLLASVVSKIFKKKHFVTAAADVDDNIKQKPNRASFNKDLAGHVKETLFSKRRISQLPEKFSSLEL